MPVVLAAGSLVLAACSSAVSTSQATAAPTPAGVQAGMQIGTMPAAPSGWAAPTQITPVGQLPGMFQSVGTSPATPMAKVRVFFLGMQW